MIKYIMILLALFEKNINRINSNEVDCIFDLCKILAECKTYSGQVLHASARTNTHKPMLWCEELSVYCAKLSVDWHHCPLISGIILGTRARDFSIFDLEKLTEACSLNKKKIIRMKK